MKQRGYLNLDLGGFLVAVLIVGAILGGAMYAFAGWAWPHVKQLIIWSLT